MGTARSSGEATTLLIKGGAVMTMNPSEEIVDHGYVLIEHDRISSVGDVKEIPPDYKAEEIIDAGGCLIMPGLVNTHTHAAMSCLRGLADDLPLKTWLEDYIFPVESRHVNPNFVYQGTLLAGMEMLRSGTTCFCDGYFYEEAAAEAVLKLGLRAILAEGIVDFPTPDVPNPETNIENGKNYLERSPSSPLITSTLFCHSAYTCNPETLKKTHDLCRHYSVPFLIHLAETEEEVQEINKRYGTSPVQHLANVGVLDEGTVAAHCVWVPPPEFPLLKERGAKIAHCPESNMKLGSGVAPVPDFLAHGIPVGIGTDGCASNNDLDLFSEMDTAAKIHKLAARNPAVMDAKAVVKMATVGGAEVLGLHHEIGSLEPGKKADIIILNWRQPHLTPTYNYFSHLVYSATGHDVQSVIVDGKVVMRDRQIVTADENEALDAVEEIGKEIKKGMALSQ
jgi:5-methylthioadenosine/S-adenosylhomocysteine deaminase